MEPENTGPLEEENHLNQTIISGSMLIFGGVLQFRYLVFSFHVKLRRMIQVGIDVIHC